MEVFAQVEAAFGAPVQEGYGLSEASSIITSNPMHGPRKPGSVGLPLPGVYGLKGHSLVFRYTPEGDPKALFVELETEDGQIETPEVMPRTDGTTYICGMRGDDALPYREIAPPFEWAAANGFQSCCQFAAPPA